MRIPDGTEMVRWVDVEYRGIRFVIVPRSVRELCPFVFERCKRLREVIFEDGSRLRKIGKGCFCGSGLEQITLPSAVEEISVDAFQNCERLRKVC